jgi:hypothetical protein
MFSSILSECGDPRRRETRPPDAKPCPNLTGLARFAMGFDQIPAPRPRFPRSRPRLARPVFMFVQSRSSTTALVIRAKGAAETTH